MKFSKCKLVGLIFNLLHLQVLHADSGDKYYVGQMNNVTSRLICSRQEANQIRFNLQLRESFFSIRQIPGRFYLVED